MNDNNQMSVATAEPVLISSSEEIELSLVENETNALASLLVRGMEMPLEIFETPSGREIDKGKTYFTIANVLGHDLYRMTHVEAIEQKRQEFMKIRSELSIVGQAQQVLRMMMIGTRGLRMQDINVNLLTDIPGISPSLLNIIWNTKIERMDNELLAGDRRSVTACGLSGHFYQTVRDEYDRWLGALIEKLCGTARYSTNLEGDVESLHSTRQYISHQLASRTCSLHYDNESNAKLTRFMFELNQRRNRALCERRCFVTEQLRTLQNALCDLNSGANFGHWLVDNRFIEIINNPPCELIGAQRFDLHCFFPLREALKINNLDIALELVYSWHKVFGVSTLQAVILALEHIHVSETNTEPQGFFTIPTIVMIGKENDETDSVVPSPRHVWLNNKFRLCPGCVGSGPLQVHDISLRLTLIALQLLELHELQPMVFGASFVHSKAMVANVEHSIVYRLLWEQAEEVGVDADLDHQLVIDALSSPSTYGMQQLVYDMTSDCACHCTQDLVDLTVMFKASPQDLDLQEYSFHVCQLISNAITKRNSLLPKYFADTRLIYNAILLFIPIVLNQRAQTLQTSQLALRNQLPCNGHLTSTQRMKCFYYLWSHVLNRSISPGQQTLTHTEYTSLPASVRLWLHQIAVEYPYVVCLNNRVHRQRNGRTKRQNACAILFPFQILLGS